MSINDHVTCQLCSKPFSDPRILPCLHSFCCQCLHCEMEKVGPQQSMKCPTCQRSIPIPVGGASALPLNLHLEFDVQVSGYMSKFGSDSGVSCTFCVNGCANSAVAFCCSCHTFLCKTGYDCHKYVPQLLEHSVIGLDKESAELLPTVLKPTEQYCSIPKHKKQELNFYCETCNCLVCRDCIVVLHKDHNITELSIIAEAHRDEMKETLQCVQEINVTLDSATDATNMMIQQVETSKEETKLAIENTFAKLIENLVERKEAMLSELEAISLSKTKSLTHQKELFTKYQEDIAHYTEVTTHVLKTHSDHEVVALGGLVPTELKAILNTIENVSFIPNQRSYLKLSAQLDKASKELSKFGEIVDLSPSPHETTCTLSSVARVNIMQYAKVTTMSSNGERYPCGGLQVKAELRLKSHDGPVISGEVEDHGDGTYTISLTPQNTGLHQLYITMDGHNVQKSPFELNVRGDYSTLCNPQQVITVTQPYCVAVHDKGDIFVGCNDDCIYVFDKRGQLKTKIGGSGRNSDWFDGPVGIFIKGDVLYVADVGNHCIQKLTTTGKFLCVIGEQGSGQGQLNAPSDIVVDSRDRVIVADRDNSRVQLFHDDGDWLLTIDGNQSGDHGYKYPCSLALDPEDNIHVAAFGSDTVKVFTPGGTLLRVYGPVEGPRGIAIDDDGYSLVCDQYLTIFDPQGHKIHTVENLNQPSGITIVPRSGNVYVVLFNANNVLRYTLKA